MTETTSVLKTSSEGGGVAIHASGVVTVEGARVMRAEFLRYALTHEVARVLLDFSNACIVFSPEEWLELAAESASRARLRTPIGLLVAEVVIDHAWNYCEHLCNSGRIAVAFTSSVDAYWWVRGLPERRRGPRPSSASERLRNRRGRQPLPGSRGR